MITKFLLVLAWIFFVISTIVLLFKCVGYLYYHSEMNKLERLMHQMKGVTVKFHFKFWPYVLMIAGAYLITYYFA